MTSDEREAERLRGAITEWLGDTETIARRHTNDDSRLGEESREVLEQIVTVRSLLKDAEGGECAIHNAYLIGMYAELVG